MKREWIVIRTHPDNPQGVPHEKETIWLEVYPRVKCPYCGRTRFGTLQIAHGVRAIEVFCKCGARWYGSTFTFVHYYCPPSGYLTWEENCWKKKGKELASDFCGTIPSLSVSEVMEAAISRSGEGRRVLDEWRRMVRKVRMRRKKEMVREDKEKARERARRSNERKRAEKEGGDGQA